MQRRRKPSARITGLDWSRCIANRSRPRRPRARMCRSAVASLMAPARQWPMPCWKCGKPMRPASMRMRPMPATRRTTPASMVVAGCRPMGTGVFFLQHHQAGQGGRPAGQTAGGAPDRAGLHAWPVAWRLDAAVFRRRPAIGQRPDPGAGAGRATRHLAGPARRRWRLHLGHPYAGATRKRCSSAIDPDADEETPRTCRSGAPCCLHAPA